jgi:isoamylase
VESSVVSVHPGKPYPLGATLTVKGTHFALVSRNATRVWLQIYDEPTASYPALEFELRSEAHRTGDVWHIDVEGLGAGTLYTFRVDGPFAPEKGLRFNRHRPLLDPYARALTSNFRWDLSDALAYHTDSPDRDLSFRMDGGAATLPKCIVIDESFDWQGDRPLNYPLRESIIYEAHIRGLSLHGSAEVKHPGTYRGAMEMIPYLKDLGITSVEFLPIQEFDEFEIPRHNPLTGERLTNYWGYNTIAFFAPKGSYAADGGLGEQVVEFKEMVREFHRAGIEVILDVVFNHSGEGNELGPTLNFRGIDNTTYYMLEENPRFYRNYSGTGNTLNCNNPVMRTLITEALHYWVVDMHVDGFRFDLGSVLGRDPSGRLLDNAPIIERIAEDPILRDTKIIAEAWDAGGAYQVGAFQGRWAEWNDQFRDDVRRFWRGDRNTVGALATRFSGSSDLYHREGRTPFHSINFITAHDGFTLRDLVSYNQKHNEANGENNRDGHNSNFSFNYGAEGETNDPAIQETRMRQMKNFLATLILSLGTPMMLSGDEFGRTQRGNNNAYCQNNEVSWNDYRLGERYGDLFRFIRTLIALRREHPVFNRPDFYTGRDTSRSTRADIEWHGSDGRPLDWSQDRHCFAVYIDGTELAVGAERVDDDFFIIFNAGKDDEVFSVPDPPAGLRWIRVVDTYRPSPEDIREPGFEEPVSDGGCLDIQGRSLVVLRTTPAGAPSLP